MIPTYTLGFWGIEIEEMGEKGGIAVRSASFPASCDRMLILILYVLLVILLQIVRD
jgi:hypothetical protein